MGNWNSTGVGNENTTARVRHTAIVLREDRDQERKKKMNRGKVVLPHPPSHPQSYGSPPLLVVVSLMALAVAGVAGAAGAAGLGVPPPTAHSGCSTSNVG